jgi:hypothetical protein
LLSNTASTNNTATGFQALSGSTGNFNNAFARNALNSITSGDGNVAVGDLTLANATACDNNVAIGNSALTNSTVGNFNIALGLFAGQNTSGGNNIVIGNRGVAAEDNPIRIGDEAVQTATYIAGISGQTASGGVAVYVNADGKLGTTTSSRRYKEDIKRWTTPAKCSLRLSRLLFDIGRNWTRTAYRSGGL